MLCLSETCALHRTGPGLRQIQVRCADAADFLERQPAGSFTGFSLSNILDGTNPAYAQRLFAAVQHAAAPGAMVVLRSFREPQCTTEANHAAEDRAMLWGIVDVRPAGDSSNPLISDPEAVPSDLCLPRLSLGDGGTSEV